MKSLVKGFIALILIIASIPWSSDGTAIANTTSEKLKVLQIVNDSKTKLTNTDKYEVTTMEMKEFVAERKDLDGLYDVIYIADGKYSPELPKVVPDTEKYNETPNDVYEYYEKWERNKKDTGYNKIKNGQVGQKFTTTVTNDTKSVMNDITELKANEIINYYIKKGLPVFIHESVKNQTEESKKIMDRKSVLKDKLVPYTQTNEYSNVKLIKDISALNSEMEKLLPIKPNIIIQSKNTSKKLNTGDFIQVTFKVENTNITNTVANFYIDSNFNNSYASREVLVSKNLESIANGDGTYTISYQLPKSYAGPRYWKVELVNESNKLKDYELGYFEVSGEKIIINVLQVTNEKNPGSLIGILNGIKGFNKKTELSGSYKHNDFEINIDVIDKAKFSSTNNNDKTNYKYLNNGYYNMIIFGFQDDFGINVDVLSTPAVQNEIAKFIDSGQSVFLTHDTLYRDYFSLIVDNKGNTSTYFSHESEWIDTFLKVSGQTYEIKPKTWANGKTKEQLPHGYILETNMGFQGPVQTTSAINVNDGLMSMYPYNLTNNNKSVISINTTHAQYFALDLENRDVIPWYNLYSTQSGHAYKGNDAWNHYYTYSHKNITYSGAGHSSSGFTEDEKKLFINTMYRAFLSNNIAPIITPVSPGEGEQVYSYQEQIGIEFLVEDLDISDRYIDLEITINGGTPIKLDDVINGSTQVIQYDLKETDREIRVKVEAIDESGAKAVKEWVIKVTEMDAPITIDKKLSGNFETDKLKEAMEKGLVRVDNPFTIEYSINAKQSISAKNNVKFTEDAIFNYDFYEFIPDTFLVDENSFAGLIDKKIEKVDGGTKITGILPTFYYEVNSINNTLQLTSSNNKISLTAILTPTTETDHKFVEAKIHNDKDTFVFKEISVKARKGLTEVLIPEEVYLRVDEDKKIFLEYLPDTVKTNGVLEPIKVSNNTKLVTVEPSGTDIVLTAGDKEGESIVTVKVSDVFGKEVEKQIKVIVVEKVNEIRVNPNPIKVEIGKTKDVIIEVLPVYALNKDVVITMGDESIAVWDEEKQQVKGLELGETTITITSVENPKVSVVVSVTVYELLKEIKFTKPYYNLVIGAVFDVEEHLIYNPSTIKKKDLEDVFSSLGAKVEVFTENGKWKLRAKEVGTSQVTVIAPPQEDFSQPTATAFFEVIQPKNNNNESNLPSDGRW